MNEQPSSTIITRLCWGVFFLALLFLAFQVIPRALGQRDASKQAAARVPSQLLPSDAQSVPSLPRRSPIPLSTSGVLGAHAISVPRAPKAPQVILYDQYNNAGRGAFTSQDFEESRNALDDELADDFVVPGGQTWNVESIDADGLYSGVNCPGPAQNFNVRFYSDSAGLPGALVESRIGMSYVQVGSTFTVTVSPAVSLAAGTYWVSVQARQDSIPNGQWFWTDRTVQSNSPAAWQNPGGGWGRCPTWAQKVTCGGDPGAPDQVYRLNGTTGGGGMTGGGGTTEGGTPTPTPSPTCTPIVVNGSITTSDPTQIDRLFREGVPQNCNESTTCSIFGDPTPHHYDAYTFTNTGTSQQCVRVDINTPCTDTNSIFIGAYLGSFDPNNICTNWIGDSGSSPDPHSGFNFDLCDGETVVVVVSEVIANAGCSSYTVTVRGLGCQQATPTPTPTPGQIRLRFGAHLRDGFKVVKLNYIGATSPTVDVFRDGALLATVNNDGSYVDVLTVRGIYTYQVCEAGTTNCSNEVTVTFSGPSKG
jgi:hypothetical protein